MSSEECEQYINFGNSREFEEAKIGTQDTQVTNKGVRNNDRLLFFIQDLADELWKRVEQFLPEKTGIYSALNLNEMFRIYKYSKEQRFKMHRDGSYERNDNEISFFSFIIYLNDSFEGGETEFRKLETIVPKKRYRFTVSASI